MGLPFDVFRVDVSSLGINWDLARDEKQVSNCGHRAVRADSLGDASWEDSFNSLHMIYLST